MCSGGGWDERARCRESPDAGVGLERCLVVEGLASGGGDLHFENAQSEGLEVRSKVGLGMREEGGLGLVDGVES